MDMSAILTAYQGIKNIKEIVGGIVDSKADAIAKEKVFDVKERLGTIQDTLFELRDVLAALQDENSRLKVELANVAAWDMRAAQYELVRTKGGAVVMKFTADPEHYACPTCFEARKIHLLQDNRTYRGLYTCNACSATYPIDPSRPVSMPRLAI